MKAIYVIALVALVVAALFVPIIPVQVQSPVTVPFERPATYEVLSATLSGAFDLSRGYYVISEVVVKNTDSQGGTFQVTHRLYTVDGLFGAKTTSDYLAPGDTKTSKAEFDTKLGQDVRGNYSVSSPTVIDHRVETETKTVYRSAIDIIINH